MKRYIILLFTVFVISLQGVSMKASTAKDNPVSLLVSEYSEAEGMRVSSLAKSIRPLLQGLASFFSEITGQDQTVPEIGDAEKMIVMDYTACEPAVMTSFVTDLTTILEKAELILGTGKAFGKAGVWSVKDDGKDDGTVVIHYPDMCRVIILLGDKYDSSSAEDDPDRLF